MKVSFKLTMGMTLFHSQTMKELKIENVIEQTYDDSSKEYLNLCKEYNEAIRFERDSDKDKFDKELMIILSKDALKIQEEKIQTIEEVVKNCYYQGTTAFISFGGYMINPKDFCAIRVDEFNIQLCKK